MTHKRQKHAHFSSDLHSTINAHINAAKDAAGNNGIGESASQVSAAPPPTIGVVKSIVVTSTMSPVTQASPALSSSQLAVTSKPRVVPSQPLGVTSQPEVTTTPSSIERVATEGSTAVESAAMEVAKDATDNGPIKNGFFTYKIHEYSGCEKMYECDICLYMTKELFDMYDHAGTHTDGYGTCEPSEDSITDTPGMLWECLYCSFHVEKHSVLVTHIKSAHVGKTLKMRRQRASPPPKKGAPLPTMADARVGAIDTQTTLWGCYYCSTFHTFDRSAAISHVQSMHKGQKLMITRRRVVATSGSTALIKTPGSSLISIKDISGSNASNADAKSRRKQSLTSRVVGDNDAGRTEKIASQSSSSSVNSDCTNSATKPRKVSKYDGMIAFLNHSNDLIRQQISDIGPATRSEADKPDMSGGESRMAARASLIQSVRAAARSAEIVHLPELPNDLKADWRDYFTIDRKAGTAQCLKCGHRSNGSRAFTNMREHMTMHTNERLWGCPYCDHRCNRRILIYKHVVSSHPDSPIRLVHRRPFRNVSGPASRRRPVVEYLTPDKRLQGPRSVRTAKLLKLATDVFVCPSCSRTSVSKGDIRTHIKFAHPEDHAQNLCGEVVLRPSLSPPDTRVTAADMKTASVDLIRLEDFSRFAILQRIVEEAGETLHHDLDINDGSDDEDPAMDTTETLVLPKSSETGKYKCPYCLYRTFRPLIVKQHILYRHPSDEIKVCDFRASSAGKQRTKFLYPCALLSCQFITPMREALYAHIGKNPLHVGNTATASDKDEPDALDEPMSKITKRCSSLRSASLRQGDDSAIEDDGSPDEIFSMSNDKVLFRFIEDLKQRTPVPQLLLKCRYCDVPSSFDPVDIKSHLISEHPRWDPLVLDVKARFYRQECRLYMCPLLSCDFMTYSSRDFVKHLRRVHADSKFHLPVMSRHKRKARLGKRKARLGKRPPDNRKPWPKMQFEDRPSSFPYLCFYCRVSCVDRPAVKEHLLEQHPFEYWFIALSTKARNDRKRMKRYLCKSRMCDFYCHSLEDYDRHACVVAERATLDGVKVPPAQTCSKIYQCSYCTCMMTSVHDMRAHVSKEHASSDGYTEIQSGFGENGAVVMNVNSEVTSSGRTDVDLTESSPGSALVSPVGKTPKKSSDTPVRVRTTVRIVPGEVENMHVEPPNEVSDDLTDPNDTSVTPHTTVGIDSGDDVDARPNEVSKREKQDGEEEVNTEEAASVPRVKLTLKLGNNLKRANTEHDVGDGYAADSESDLDARDDSGTVSTTMTSVNGQTAEHSGDGSDDSDNSNTTSKLLSEIETPSTEKVVGSKDLSGQEDMSATESDSGSDNGSARGSLLDEHSGKEATSIADAEVIATREDTTIGGGECNRAATEDATLQAIDDCIAGQSDEVGDDGKTNGDPESPHPPVTISIKIVPPKDGWKAKTDSGESSDSSNDDSLETDDDVGSSDSNTRSSVDE